MTKSQIGFLSSQTMRMALHILIFSNTASMTSDFTVRPTKE